MKTTIQKITQSLRRAMTRASSLLMLFQKTPLVQLLLPEAQMLGNAHVLNATALTIATVAGLGAYDSVSGATAVSQTSPTAGSSTVSASSGVNLNFVMQIVGAGGHTPASWSVVGTLPTGLTHANAKNSKTDSISGVPTQTGSFPITVKAWENSNFTGRSATGSFTINVAAPPGLVISSQPASVTIGTGLTTTLQVTVTGGTGINYQWYQGNTGSTTTPVGTNSRTFTTPALTSTTSYWVKAWNTTFPSGTNSATATVTVLNPVVITTPPASTTIMGGTTATLSVTATGSTPMTYQWYRGTSGNTSNPVGTNAATFTTPVLTASESYWVKVSNALTTAGVSSPTAVVTVNQPARIAMQPIATQVIDAGQTTTLTVSAIGTDPIVYQWYQGAVGDTSTPVGANQATFTTPPLQSTTSYWVKVSNEFAPEGVNSTAATVTVNQPLSIATQPVSANISSGGKVTLSVVAAGTGPYVYQWYQGNLGNTSLPVGKGTSTFTSAALKANTSFWVRVTSPTNSTGVSSELATVTVLSPVVISTHPLPTVVVSGGTATLQVVATGSGPFTYQWYEGKAGVVTKPVGTDSPILETTALTANTMFWVLVSNPVTPLGVKSKAATVTVNVPASILTQPANVTIKTGASAKLSVVAAGTAKFTFQWYQGESGDTSMPVGKPTAAFATPKLTATTKYWVKVMNAVNPSGAFSQTATITVGDPAAIQTQPLSVAINSGETATLTVAASGLEPMVYQWYEGKAGVVTTPVGANEATFTTPPLTATTMYWVKVSNPLLPAGVKSLNATVTVNPAMAARSTTVAPASRYLAWAQTQFTSEQLDDEIVSSEDADPDGDGLTNAAERLFGTLPQQSQSGLLAIEQAAGSVTLSFDARSTEQSSDATATRHYAIETTSDMSGEWTTLEGYNDIEGHDQDVTLTLPQTKAKAFYRLKAWIK